MNAVLSWRTYFVETDLDPLDLELRTKFVDYKLEDSVVVDTVARRLPPVRRGHAARSVSSVALLGHWGMRPNLGRPLRNHERLFGWLHAIKPGLVVHVSEAENSRYCGFLERVPKGTSALDWPSIGLVPIVGRDGMFRACMTIEGTAETLVARPDHRDARFRQRAGVAGYMYRDLDRDTYEYAAFSRRRWAEISRWLNHWLPRGE